MGTIISDSITARLVSDKPVRKTPYQVKGVFMKQFSNEKIIPFLDGQLRNKYLYPRVQVKILDEQIYLVGLNEGVDPILSLIENLDSINFGDIIVRIEDIDVEKNTNCFSPVDKLLNYKFITPWVGLNTGTTKNYNNVVDDEKVLFLNKLLGKNLLFLSKELGFEIKEKIYTRMKIEDLNPNKHDENGWRSFEGGFQTNFILPNFIGFGNGITRGFGSIFSLNNVNSIDFREFTIESDQFKEQEIDEKGDLLSYVTVHDTPLINRRKKKKRYKGKRKKHKSSGRIQSNKYGGKKNKGADFDDESRFNSEEYHQKQHDL